jgi:hypothetical protein
LRDAANRSIIGRGARPDEAGIDVPYIASNYDKNPAAPAGQWVCTRASTLGPYADVPDDKLQRGPTYCGQCVSYVTHVCPTIPVNTNAWHQGAAVKDNGTILPGTAIATFNAKGVYYGHAAIYVRQDDKGIYVYDQWVFGAPKAISARLIRWNGTGIANNGDGFYVVEP